MKKKILAILLTVCTTLSLAACGGTTTAPATDSGAKTAETKAAEAAPASEAAPEAAAPAGAQDLTFWTFQAAHQKFMEDAAVRWNETYPDRPINFKAETLGYDDLHNNLMISLQTGTGAPDIVDIEISMYANFITGDEASIPLVPLNDVIEPDKENLIMGRFDNYANHGNYYGVDYHVGATCLMYNKEIFEQAGVDINSIKTWDDFKKAGKTIREKTGKYIMACETTEHWTYYPLITEKKSDFFDPATGEVTLDNQANIDTLQWLLDGLNDDIFCEMPGGFCHSEEWYAYMNEGNVASIGVPLWYLNRFTDYMPDLKGKMAVRTLPVWEEGGANSAGLGGTGTSVTNQAKDVQLAKDFLYFSKISREGAIRTWTELGFDPIRKDVYDDPEMTAPNRFTDYFGDDVYQVMNDTAGAISALSTSNPLYPEALTRVQKTVMFNVLHDKSQTPEEALTQAANELRAMQ
ncbi:MAG: ABC transporter substrate-binding protein [Lachnospiraceae bacterium]|nr:ABC transporter substrate-binding protein [Lachnospiraceae bacterium]